MAWVRNREGISFVNHKVLEEGYVYYESLKNSRTKDYRNIWQEATTKLSNFITKGKSFENENSSIAAILQSLSNAERAKEINTIKSMLDNAKIPILSELSDTPDDKEITNALNLLQSGLIMYDNAIERINKYSEEKEKVDYTNKDGKHIEGIKAKVTGQSLMEEILRMAQQRWSRNSSRRFKTMMGMEDIKNEITGEEGVYTKTTEKLIKYLNGDIEDATKKVFKSTLAKYENIADSGVNQELKDLLKAELGKMQNDIQSELSKIISSGIQKNIENSITKHLTSKDSKSTKTREDLEVVYKGGFNAITVRIQKGNLNEDFSALLQRTFQQSGFDAKSVGDALGKTDLFSVLNVKMSIKEEEKYVEAIEKAINKTYSGNRSSTIKNISEEFKRQKDKTKELFIALGNEKTYELGSMSWEKGKGFSGGTATKVETFLENLDYVPSFNGDFSTLLNAILQVPSGAIGSEYRTDLELMCTSLIGHFLFDDFTEIGNKLSSTIHYVRVNDISIPLSVLYNALAKALRSENAEVLTRNIVNVSITAPALSKTSGKLQERLEAQRNKALDGTAVSVHFLRNIKDFINEYTKKYI